MVALKAVRAANQTIKTQRPGLVALFIGATSGIAEQALRQLARLAQEPKIYVVGRKAAAAAPLMAELRQANPKGEFLFIERNVALVKDTDLVCEEIKQREARLDLLVMAAGFISFSGRQNTAEGLDGSMATRYYTRARFIQQLLPLLSASPSARVLSILAGGQEGQLVEADLDLRNPKNYSIGAAATHTATMMTLTMSRFAAANPGISFVHAFPGVVWTGNMGKGSEGILKYVMTYLVVPLLWFIAKSVSEVGDRMLFHATSPRYATESQGEPGAISMGLVKAKGRKSGVFLLGPDSETVGDEALLDGFEQRHSEETVWNHTLAMFEQSAVTRNVL